MKIYADISAIDGWQMTRAMKHVVLATISEWMIADEAIVRSIYIPDEWMLLGSMEARGCNDNMHSLMVLSPQDEYRTISTIAESHDTHLHGELEWFAMGCTFYNPCPREFGPIELRNRFLPTKIAIGFNRRMELAGVNIVSIIDSIGWTVGRSQVPILDGWFQTIDGKIEVAQRGLDPNTLAHAAAILGHICIATKDACSMEFWDGSMVRVEVAR